MNDIVEMSHKLLEYIQTHGTPLWQTVVSEVYGGGQAGLKEIAALERHSVLREEMRGLLDVSTIHALAGSVDELLANYQIEMGGRNPALPSEIHASRMFLEDKGHLILIGPEPGLGVIAVGQIDRLRRENYLAELKIDRHDIANVMGALSSYVAGSKKDIKTLLSLLEQRDNEIEDLKIALAKARAEAYVSTTSTWG